MEILRDTHFDFMKYRNFWIIVSLILVLVGVFFVFVHGDLNVGVDFAGGTQINLRFKEKPDIDRLRGVLEGAGLEEVTMQSVGDEGENEVMVRTRLVEGEQQASLRKVVAALDSELNPGKSGKPDINAIGADALAAVLTQADPDKLGPAGAARYLQTAEKIMEQRRSAGLFNSWDQLSGLGGLSPAGLQTLQQRTALGNFAVLGVESVGPQIGEELRKQGFYAVLWSLVGMLVYIWVRFELRFAVGAIMGCIHDVLVTLFLFALFDYEFNLTTVAAFLTLIGYSVNDTVVIFDRIRENMRKTRRKPLAEIMNDSINQTLSRTILTGGSTLLAVGALLALGSDVIKGFAFVLLVGIIVGTYSSIYVASAFALLWEQWFGTEAKAQRAARASDTPAHTKAG